MLIYAVFSIHTIIKKYGLSERVNYRMFFVNAFGMFMYVAAVFVWYGFFYYYAKTYYTHTGLPDYDVPKGKARAIATIAWLCCNIISFLSQLALIAILCQLGQSEKRPDTKKVAKETPTKYVETEEDVERLGCEALIASTSELNHNLKTQPSNLSSINQDGFVLAGDDAERFDEIETTDLPENDMETRIWAQFVRHGSETQNMAMDKSHKAIDRRLTNMVNSTQDPRGENLLEDAGAADTFSNYKAVKKEVSAGKSIHGNSSTDVSSLSNFAASKVNPW